MNRITENPDIVLAVIDFINQEFNNTVFSRYNYGENKQPLTREATNFYKKGHCPSYARILFEIFEGQCTFYEDFSSSTTGADKGHTIVKIGNHFYDVFGVVDYYVKEENNSFKPCDNASFPFYEEYHCCKHEHDEEIKQDLILLGRQFLQKITLTQHENLTRKLINKLPTK